ncbi:MAG TPA: proteasome activator [Streptosporangiaceae bacterium]|nr:proteasome activator [Streptosporangiaceae bacterium]
MASGERRPAGRDQVAPTSRIVVALGRPAQGPKACRVEYPERVVRMWALLNEAGGELQLETMPPESLARVQRLLKAVSAELERSVSPALAEELRHLVDWGRAEPDASEVRIEYASMLGWVGGLVIGMYSQLEDAKRDLRMAGHSAGRGPGGGDSPGGTGVPPGDR